MNAAKRAPPARGPAVRALAVGIAMPFVAGVLAVLGFAPFSLWPVPIVSLALLFAAWRRSQSALQAGLSGFAFGLGYFLAGVSWVFVSLHTFGDMHAVLAAIATFFFGAYLALFPATAGAIAFRLAQRDDAWRMAAAAGAFVAMEWLRGTLFSGFPWLTMGTSQVPSGPLAGWAPVVGAYGVSLAMALVAAGAVVALARDGAARVRLACVALVVALGAGGLVAGRIAWTQAVGAPVRVSLLQGNVPQQLKWEDAVRGQILIDYRRMILAAPPGIVVVPETALPAFLDELPAEYLDSLRARAAQAGQDILLGTVERDGPREASRYFNSLVRITGDGAPSYRKRHLVPFGEFIPPGFHWVLAILHIPMSDFDSGKPRQAPLVAQGVPLGVAICYEDIFGEEVIEALPQARLLVNVSNDAWFGDSLAADQHLQASQARALESGRWMVRSTNTGATAAIDEHGRVVERLPPFVAGTLVAMIQPREGSTPYVRTGNASVLAMLAALLGLVAWRSAGETRGTRREVV